MTSTVIAEETPGAMLIRAQRLHQSGVMMEAISVYKQYLIKVPNDDEARIGIVELYLSLNLIQESLPHISILQKHIPNNQRVKELAELSRKHKGNQRRKQISQFEQEANHPKAKPKTVLEYARYLAANGMVSKSIVTYKRYLETNPKDDTARLEMAKQYAWSKNYSACTTEINTLIANNPKNVDARLLLGDILYWQGHEKRALESYQYVLKISPNNSTAKKKINRITNTPAYKMSQLLEALKKEPNGPHLNDLAIIYLDVGREFEADSLVERRLNAAPEDTVAMRLSEEIEQRMQKRFQGEIARYEEELNRNPKDITARLAVARYYASIPDYMTALEHYNVYLDIVPRDYLIRSERAHILSWSGNTELSIEEFRRVTVSLPDNRGSRLGLAEALLISNVSLPEAEQIFYNDWKANPDELRSKMGYADALRRQGKYPEARKLYKNIIASDSLNENAHKGLMMLDQDFGPLIQRLEYVLKTNPDDNATRNRLSGLYFDSKRYYEAEQLTLQLLEQKPKDKRLLAFLKQIQQEKRIYQQQELIDARLRVQLHPDDFEARIAFANLLVDNGNTDEGIAQYRLIFEQRPDDQKLALKLAELYNYSKRLNEASAIYRQLADENPANFDYRFNYAQTLSWMGENDRALSEYERALRLNPESVECQLGMANAYRYKGDMYAAHDAYTVIVAKHPKNEEARNAQKSLNGPLFRGAEVTTRSGWDSEYFLLRETYFGIIGNFTLRMRVRAGFGSLFLEQKDLSRRYMFSEKGWFYFGKLDYQFDKLTRAAAELRYYSFELVQREAFWLEIEHEFKDVPELVGLTGKLRYSSQFAILDVAATKSLQTWWEDLMSEKISVWGKYQTEDPYTYEGEIAYISISDGNIRTDIWLDGGYRFKKYLFGGLRYDNISAANEVSAYWSPLEYQTVSGWIRLENSFTRWSYSLYGSVGRVLTTQDNLRRFSGNLSYRISKMLSLNLSYLTLQTVRPDGKYWYKGASGSLLWNL